MKSSIAAAITALVLGLAPVGPAMADVIPSAGTLIERDVSRPDALLGVHDDPAHTGCPMSSASEGNANQQNFPVKQYGQTSGGTRC